MKNRLILFLSIVILSCTDKPTKKKDIAPESIVEKIGVRNAQAMVYHPKESIVYLFGGANEKEVLSDLWTYTNNHWKKTVTKKSPTPRTFPAITYDEKENRIIVFGGSKVLFGKESTSKNLLNDTWQFKDGNWKKIATTYAPIPRAESTIVYDKHRNRIVLFGGYTIKDGNYIKLGDTWEFYNNNWHLVSETGPTSRHGAPMIYDSGNKRTILFGGSTSDKQYGKYKGETWSWNGTQWNRLEIEQPRGVFNATMIYNEHKKQLFRFGGWNGNTRINDTWIFSDNTWKQLKTTIQPTSRNHSSMVYDTKRKKVILFGGHDGEKVFGDTWEFSNNTWKKLIKEKSKKRVKNNH